MTGFPSRPGAVAGAFAAIALLALTTAAARPAAPTLRFTVVANTDLPLTDVVWTGTRFLYVDNTRNRVFAADRSGAITGLLATMPTVVEETRCVVSPARYGFPRGGILCHSPDNRIYRIAADGAMSIFATLPETEISDGALAVDGSGRFGHRLIAATGRSSVDGGSVFTIDAAGTVRKIGTYPGPGGAENAVVAPAAFGARGGWLLLTLDKDDTYGSVVAVDANGATATIARLSDGANPIAVIPGRLRSKGAPPAGFYVVDTTSKAVLTASADQFEGQAGHVIVGSELHARMWIIAPKGSGYTATPLATNLTAPLYNLEGATFVP